MYTSSLSTFPSFKAFLEVTDDVVQPNKKH